MGYTPVPVVVAGDWIDEVFINTYWGDNMAAGVPDIFTAKGQIAVASAANAAGALAVGSNNNVLMADSAQALGVKWGNNVVLLTTVATNTSWDGDAYSTGTTTVTVNSFNAVIPNTARAILATVSVKWAAASDGSTLNLKPTGGSAGNCLLVRSQVANYFQDQQGIVPLNASGQFDVVISGAGPSAVYINIWGYIL